MWPYTGSMALAYAAFRLGLAVAFLGAVRLLWRRPRPAVALAVVVAQYLIATAAYLWPLGRSYGLEDATDRSFNLGMAARVAVGGSPFEHTQVGFASPEPLWNLVIAALALFDPARVAAALALLSPLAVLALGLGVYLGLRADDSEADAWERVLMVTAVLGLSSLSMSPRPPTPAFFLGNILLKPQHGIAFGLVAVALGTWSRGGARAPWRFGLLLGALGWVFLLHWGYLLPCLALALLLAPREERAVRGALVSGAVSVALVVPYVGHLLADYSPAQGHRAAAHMWNDERGLALAVPNWSTLDLGPLLVLAVVGAVLLWRRGQARDRTLLAAWIATLAVVTASLPAALLGIAPEPDELHYFLRFVMALAAGATLAAGARLAERLLELRPGQGALLALLACLPLSFPSYWDPPTMDRYFAMSRPPIRPKVLAYGLWVRDHTPADAVFVAGRSAATWIPVLSGRRVLLNEAGELLPRDLAARKEAERILLTSEDPVLVQATARRWGVGYLAIDEPFLQEYGVVQPWELARAPVCETVFINSAVRIVRIREAAPR